MPPAPARVGPYEVLAELGRGGMGRVVRARHVESGAEHALKLLDAGDAPAELLVRFRREGEALARAAGDGVVAVHGAGADGPTAWLAMDLMPGGSLRDRLRAAGRLPWREAAAVVRDVARALDRAHAAGLVHRDVKAENILFDAQGAPRLADFGVTRDLADRLTATGTLVGTPTTMAPEQLDGRPADRRADVWGLGAVLHEAVAGAPPFRAATLPGQRHAVEGPRPSLVGAGAPPALEAVVAAALVPDRQARLPDAATLAAALDDALAGRAPRGLPAPRPARPPWGRLLALGLLVLGGSLTTGHARRARARADRALAAAVGSEAAASAALGRLAAAVDAVASAAAALRPARVGLDAAPDGTPLVLALEEVARSADDALTPGTLEAAQRLVARSRALRARAEVDLLLAAGRPLEAATLADRLGGADGPALRALALALADPAAASAALTEVGAAARLDPPLAGELAWARARAAVWRDPGAAPSAPPGGATAAAWERLAGEAAALAVLRAGGPRRAADAALAAAAARPAGAADELLAGAARAVVAAWRRGGVPTAGTVEALAALRAGADAACAGPALGPDLARLAEAAADDALAAPDAAAAAALARAALAAELAGSAAPAAEGPAPRLRGAVLDAAARALAPGLHGPTAERFADAAVAALRLGDVVAPPLAEHAARDALVAALERRRAATPRDWATHVTCAAAVARATALAGLAAGALAPEAWAALRGAVDHALRAPLAAPPRAALLLLRAEADEALGDPAAAAADLEAARPLALRPEVVLDRQALWHLDHGGPAGVATAAALLVLADAARADARVDPPPAALDPCPAWRHRLRGLRRDLPPLFDPRRGPEVDAFAARLRELEGVLRRLGAAPLAAVVDAALRDAGDPSGR